MKTMIRLILDRSGSMAGRETEVVGGVNSFIDEQRKLPDPATIGVWQFDTVATNMLRPVVQLGSIEHLRIGEYVARGGTPLLDAIGQVLTGMDEEWKLERPDRAIVVIVTDGQENSSTRFTKMKVKEMIEARQNSGQWAFIYLGADVDAFDEAGALGINLFNTAGYTKSAAGIKVAYATASASVGVMRSTGHMVADNLDKANLGEGEDAVSQAGPTPVRGSQTVPQTPTRVDWSPLKNDTSSAASGWTPPA
jgi:uncharacterized protein YegL